MVELIQKASMEGEAMTVFSDNLERIRKSSGKGRNDIAESLNVAASTYGLYEQGRREPDLDKLRQLAKIFSCSTDELLGIESDTLTEYTARLAELGLTIEYKAGQATLRRPGMPPVKLGLMKKDELAEEIKKALADYDKDTRQHKAGYITAKLIGAAAHRQADSIVKTMLSDGAKETAGFTAKRQKAAEDFLSRINSLKLGEAGADPAEGKP